MDDAVPFDGESEFWDGNIYLGPGKYRLVIGDHLNLWEGGDEAVEENSLDLGTAGFLSETVVEGGSM
jgi:hypothetical protein